jgi:hypothetical protein
VKLPPKLIVTDAQREASSAVFDSILSLTQYVVAVTHGRDRSRDSRERQHMSVNRPGIPGGSIA